jgi:hypothetical protein
LLDLPVQSEAVPSTRSLSNHPRKVGQAALIRVSAEVRKDSRRAAQINQCVAHAGLRVEDDIVQRIDHLRFSLPRIQCGVYAQTFLEYLLHAHARGEAAKRVLKHHLQLTCAARAQRTAFELIQGLALMTNAALGINQPQYRLTERRLARTGLTDNPKHDPATPKLLASNRRGGRKL